MNQTTVDSNKTEVEEYTSVMVTTFDVTETTLEVPPQDKAYGSFSTTYLEGMEISAGDCEFDEKTGEIIESNGKIEKVSEEQIKRFKADSKRKLINEIKKATEKLKNKTPRANKQSSDIASTKTKKTTTKSSKTTEGRGE